MIRSFSLGVPTETRTQRSHPDHIEMSRMSTLRSRNFACTAAGSRPVRRNKMKFVTEGKTSTPGARRSAS